MWRVPVQRTFENKFLNEDITKCLDTYCNTNLNVSTTVLYKNNCADVQISITIRIHALRDVFIQKRMNYIQIIVSYM